MDVTQVANELARRFGEEQRRVVFWYDDKGEFEDCLAEVTPPGVCLIRIDQKLGVGEPKLAVKIRVGLDEPEGKFLLYAAEPEPALEANWLLDIQCSAEPLFRADRSAMILEDLGLKSGALVDHIAARPEYFASRERLGKLKSLVSGDETVADLDRKMISVVVKAEHDDPFAIIHALFTAMLEKDGGVSVLVKLGKFKLEESLWKLIKDSVGYAEVDKRSLRRLRNCVFATDLEASIHSWKGRPENQPPKLKPLLLKGPNSAVCLSKWRDSTSQHEAYIKCADLAAADLEVKDLLKSVDVFELGSASTFGEIDNVILSGLRRLIKDNGPDRITLKIADLKKRRVSGFWAKASGTRGQGMVAAFETLVAASEFLDLCQKWVGGFEAESADRLYALYTSELYRFDQCYRHFLEHFDVAREHGLDALDSLRDEIERRYATWFLPQLAAAWDRHLVGGFLEKWHFKDVGNQHEFYQREVAPLLEKAKRLKVFVIISDALRYEAARELCDGLNRRDRIRASMGSQLGVLPSYTELGMAALLPHRTLEYTEKGDVHANGHRTAGLEARNKILQENEGVAIKATDLMAMKSREGREFVADKRVFYIYHDRIDETGDNAKSEHQVFQAVRDTVEELGRIVAHIVNNLNGGQVLVTADHGFLYQRADLSITSKNDADLPEVNVLKKNKRFVLGTLLPKSTAVYRGNTCVSAGTVCSTQFWIPRGCNRFYFTGGAQFVHGGAALQEVVVPIIVVEETHGETALKTKVQSVLVQVIGNKHVITTPNHQFRLLQTEPISERRVAVTLDIAIYDGDEVVSTKERRVFSSASLALVPEAVMLSLREMDYDRRKIYTLRLEDVESGVEVSSVPVTIDRTIYDDF